MATKRFKDFIDRVNKTNDVSKLKRIISRRNYYLRTKIKKENPEKAKRDALLMYPPIADLRIVTKSTYNRLNKISDEKVLIEELKKLIINTTRKRYRPKVAADYSNKEIDYLTNAVSALNSAIDNWAGGELRERLNVAIDSVTVEDINMIFRDHPDYWAISSGYYYAVEEFDSFMDHIFTLVERAGESLTSVEKEEMKNAFFRNDPRDYVDV